MSTKSPFPKWPKPVHDTKGDYRVEAAFLESSLHKDKDNLYQYQQELPHLPIPSVSDTLAKLLPTVLPLNKSTNQSEKATFLKAVDDFPSQVANLKLQERLEKRKNEEFSNSSWLQYWWNTLSYLKVRDPVTINVSYFYHFGTDPTLPAYNGDVDLSIPRGAVILHKLAHLRKEVCSASLAPPSVGRKKPIYLCNVQYKYAFHTCRIPKVDEDIVRMYDPSVPEHSHCIVSCKGNFFAVDFVDKKTGDPLPLNVLERRLSRVKEMADLQLSKGDKNIELGWMTSWDRDSWAKGRELLLSIGGSEIEKALEKLESGAFLLCLDDEKPISKNECAIQLLHGSMHSGRNRWFDKSMQYVVTPNGEAGMIGEHSMMDGMPTVHLAGIVAGSRYEDTVTEQKQQENEDIGAGIIDIFKNCRDILATNTNIESTVAKAKSDFKTLTDGHSVKTKLFFGYGSSFIKSAKFSPDAFAQMAIQLATYRLFEEQVGTYEATQVRVFLHGRTEVTRGVTTDSEAFIKAMGLRPQMRSQNKDEEVANKVALLRKAAETHSKCTGRASQGMGVDRHLFGLAMCVKDGEPMPDLFTHPLFVRSKHWRVSTSHLTHPHFVNWGYGEVVPDGVGLSYSIHKDSFAFNVVALKHHGWAEKLGDLLEDALLEMKAIIDMSSGENTIVARSKL